jgi:hypothetical protein
MSVTGIVHFPDRLALEEKDTLLIIKYSSVITYLVE